MLKQIIEKIENVNDENINEELVVTKNYVIKYFKMIQKQLKANSFEIQDKGNGLWVVSFKLKKGYFNLLFKQKDVKNKKDIGASYLVGFNSDNTEHYHKIPRSVINFKDVLNHKTIVKLTKDKGMELIGFLGVPEEDAPDLQVALIKNENPNAKYIITDISHPTNPKLHRIKAIKSFGDVKKGDLGGFIEKESNLSHKGNCWIYNDVLVYNNAEVYGDVEIWGETEIYDKAKVYGKAKVYYAKVYGKAKIYDEAEVYDDSEVYGNAEVYGRAVVYGEAEIYGDAKVYGDAEVNYNVSSGHISESKIEKSNENKLFERLI